MKIITCLKEVPARDARYSVDNESGWIHERNLSFEINECDEYALEEALKLKEAHGGEVVILTIGPLRAEKAMRKGLAMGADRGILVVDEERTTQSPMAFATILAKVLADEEFDLILAGTQSDDYGYAQTGVMLAEMLDLPHATIVMEIEVEPERGMVKALREMESGWFERLEMPLPALLSIQAGISQIRYASLPGIMQAKRKELRSIPLGELGVDPEGLATVQIEELYFPERENAGEILEGNAEEVIDRLMDRLKKEAKVL